MSVEHVDQELVRLAFPCSDVFCECISLMAAWPSVSLSDAGLDGDLDGGLDDDSRIACSRVALSSVSRRRAFALSTLRDGIDLTRCVLKRCGAGARVLCQNSEDTLRAVLLQHAAPPLTAPARFSIHHAYASRTLPSCFLFCVDIVVDNVNNPSIAHERHTR